MLTAHGWTWPEESVISYSNEPDFRLEGVASGRPLRLSLYFVVGPAYYFLKCTFRSDQLRILANGVVVCRPDEDVLQVTDYQGLTWRTLPLHLETLLRDYGIGHVQVRWRAETLGPGGRNVEARSPWGHAEAASVLLDTNCGELNLGLGEVSKAMEFFERVVGQDPASLPANISLIAEAGLGICELHMGQLRRAVSRHDRMEFPNYWSFDPTLPVTLRARISRCHGDLAGALGVLRATAEQVETRFPLSWIKVRMEEIRLLRTTDQASATRLAHDVLMRAEQLGLTHQQKRIQALM